MHPRGGHRPQFLTYLNSAEPDKLSSLNLTFWSNLELESSNALPKFVFYVIKFGSALKRPSKRGLRWGILFFFFLRFTSHLPVFLFFCFFCFFRQWRRLTRPVSSLSTTADSLVSVISLDYKLGVWLKPTIHHRPHRPHRPFFFSTWSSTYPTVNVSWMSLKLLQTQPHTVENRGIAMAPLFLRLTSLKTHPHSI